MSNYRLKDIIEITGIVSIVASLIFVGLELRQNRALAEAAAYQARTDSEIAFQSLFVDPQRIAEANMKFAIGEPLTDEDIAYSLQVNWVRYVHYENIHFQLERGMLTEDFWTAILDGLKPILEYLPEREWWRERRSSFRPSFAREIDALVLEIEAGSGSASVSASATATATKEIQNPPEAKPPFTSTADTVFDIIRADDPSTFSCLEYIGREERQVWDKRVDGEPVVNNFVFNSRYSDGTSVRIALNPEFETVEAAREEAERYVKPLGQLPTALRTGIRWLSIHKGREGFHAGDEQIIMYSEMSDDRLGYAHLEESVFHEAVHATWDAEHRLAEGWRKAQESDGKFMSRYAARSPEREDLAETALFAFALIHYPERMPPADSTDIRNAVPARIEYITDLLPPGSPLHYSVGPAEECGPDKK